MTDYRTVTACRLCDSTDLAEVLNLGETPLANALDGTELFPLVMNRCGSCGHHQLSIAVNPERLWGPSYPYQSGTSPVFRAHLEKLAGEVAALKPGGDIFEIASNDGTLVGALRERGCQAFGIDPSGATTAYLLQKAWPVPASELPFGPKLGFDCILALNVMAHVDDLHAFTAAVKEALAPDGVFIVEVGDLEQVIAKGHFDTIYHEHMSYHLAEPLARFFKRHGLHLADHKMHESQGGSLRLYLKHAEQLPRPADPRDMGLSVERLRGVIDSRASALRSAINQLFQRGEMVCIYGAPAKLTTLLYATGLENVPFNCVGDDNPRKIGRKTPGNHIPIVSVEDMLERKPDTILVASWNFFDDIKRKLRAAGFRGGIINPMGLE